jgi:hypothetical protein
MRVLLRAVFARFRWYVPDVAGEGEAPPLVRTVKEVAKSYAATHTLSKPWLLSSASSCGRTHWIAHRAVRRRKPKLDLQAWTIVLHFDVGTMQSGDDSDKTETETTARVASAALDPVKPLENVLALFKGNARPTISD